MGTLLSGKELVDCASKKPDITLPVKGPKEIIPTKKWVEKKQIESALELRKNILKDERIEKKQTLSYADWIEEKQMALVTEKKGSYWHHIGHYDNSELYIYPEEVLHLMEMSCLMLKFGNVPVSIQQAYSLAIGKTMTLNEYRVYSTLSKQGYKVIRFDEKQTFNSNENRPSTTKNKTPTRANTAENYPNPCNQGFKSNSTNIYINSDSSSDDCLILSENSTPSKNNGKRKKNKRKTDQSLNLSKKTKIFEMLPDCFRKQELIVNRPKSIYIPKNINITKRSYKINLHNLSPKIFRSNNSFLEQRETHHLNRRLQNGFADNSFFWNFIHRNYLLKQSVANLPFDNERLLMPYHNYLSNWSFQTQDNDLNRQIASCSSSSSSDRNIKESILQDMLKLYSLYLSLNENDISNTYLASIISLFKKYNKIFQSNNETERLSLSSDNGVKLISTENKSAKRLKKTKDTAYESIESSSDDSDIRPTKRKSNGAKKNFHSWVPDSLWGQPAYPQKSHIGRFHNWNSFNEYMDTIREISNEPGVESWSQANNIYDDRKVIAMVCISDEEMEDENINSLNNPTPILEPEDCVTVEKVLNKLQIVETETFEHAKLDDDDSDIKIFFNLYPPNMKSFKRSPQPIPSYFIAVFSATDPFPNLGKLAMLKKKLNMAAPILLAIVSFDSISFLQMENITLPVMLPDNEKIDIDNPFDFD